MSVFIKLLAFQQLLMRFVEQDTNQWVASKAIKKPKMPSVRFYLWKSMWREKALVSTIISQASFADVQPRLDLENSNSLR